MTQVIKIILWLTFLCALWLITRFVQFLFEVSDLTWEACEISNSELGLQCRIKKNLAILLKGDSTKSLFV